MLAVPLSSWAQWNETVLYTFPPGADGTYPSSSLVSDPQGNFYGTTPAGGTFNFGTVFELSPNSGGGWTETIIHVFGGSDGEAPEAGLVRDSAGNLYGTTVVGGANLCSSEGCGVVFELSPVAGGWTESVLYSFTDGADGGFPHSQLIFDAAGNLYGTTSDGGALSDCNGYGCGTVFELSPGSTGWTENVLYSFQGYPSDGSYPGPPLLFDSAGNLYGTTGQGGTYDYGTAFELSPNSSGAWNETILHSFANTFVGNDGADPDSGLIFGPGGNLFGTTGQGTFNGGGVIYELTNFSGAWEEKVLYRYNARFHVGSGGHPNGLLYRDGILYGTTEGAGSYKDGAFFKLVKGTNNVWSETVLHSFSRGGEGGYSPTANLISDGSGNFYSVTPYGGVNGYGTAFELTASDGYAETVMHSFSADPGGADPAAGLAFDSSGNLYGTAEGGGAHNNGVVFRLVPGSNGWTESVLHSFKGGTDGSLPQAPVVVDAAGNLYGTTPFGGTPGKCETSGCGTLYELSNSEGGWMETVLHSFSGTPDGIFPYAGLTFDSAGNLYGTTYQGGSSGRGTVFELSHGASGWTESVLYSFTGVSDGGFPVASVTFDSAGNLYGTASGGYSGLGVVFELTPSAGGWSMNVIYSFAGRADGGDPRAGVVFDSAGNLYGTTAEGGSSTTCYDYEGCGTVFQLVPITGGGWQKNIILNFDGVTEGNFPQSNLAFDSSGNLYGLSGPAFELSPSAGGVWTVTILDSFTTQTGGYGANGNVVFDNAGNLYGTAGGGSPELGVVFELSP
jgi:uncharacterized repeat protein (TIGR03803 family)